MPEGPLASFTVETLLGRFNKSTLGHWQRCAASTATRFSRSYLCLAVRTNRLLIPIHYGFGTQNANAWIHEVDKRSIPSIGNLGSSCHQREQFLKLRVFLFLSRHCCFSTWKQFRADPADLAIAASSSAIFSSIKNDLKVEFVPGRFIE